MNKSSGDQFAAGEQGLGYIFQPRFALLRLFESPESTSVFIEKDDDLDFVDLRGAKTLGSLKHKAEGDRVTDLSTDFWKSVRVWLARYERDGRQASNLNFYMFTTATVSPTSFVASLLDGAALDARKLAPSQALEALSRGTTKLARLVNAEFHKLTEEDRDDFFSRIVVFDGTPRIEDLPALVKDRMRSVRREHRDAVFERLEGWWNEAIVGLLVGKRTEALSGIELSDKLSAIAEEYQADNLPITFRQAEPAEEVDADGDPRLFVRQLRAIGISSDRIRNAILDYYRAWQQRSSWARENLLVTGELEQYEDRLIDEWSRYRDVVFEELDEASAEDVLLSAGKALYRWADLESGNIPALRIRERVVEPYVVRGGFHILANFAPVPKVYWHPHFLKRIEQALGTKK